VVADDWTCWYAEILAAAETVQMTTIPSDLEIDKVDFKERGLILPEVIGFQKGV
jgi:hypothetical protein